jgi:hypothetical protein
MRDLNGQYARAFNERHRRADHVFGRRFWSKAIESEEQYERTLDYILHNPVNHGFARRVGHWRWTSVPAVGRIDSPGVTRHRQADPAALARRLPDGRAAAPDGTGREIERRGLFGDVRRGFARRFYSDRAELLALGVPLQSQRDEFTGEELYTLRSENYFLDKLELDDDELAALQTALYLLEGKFAYAEPLRLALQNLALGRPASTSRPARPPCASRCSTRTTRRRCPAARQARGRDLEAADDQVPVLLDLAQPPGSSAPSIPTGCCRTTAAGT